MSYKAFVSSTYLDLKEHRARVIDELRKAAFWVDPMESWTASTDPPKRFSRDRLEGCDLCVLLVAMRRGHVPQGETSSITQLEYEAARERGIDVLVFMVDEHAPWPRQFDELDKDPEMRPWRKRLMEERGVGFFEDEPDSIEIAPALSRWLRERIVRGTDAPAATAPPEAEGTEPPPREDSPTVAPIEEAEPEKSAGPGKRKRAPWKVAAGAAAVPLVLTIVVLTIVLGIEPSKDGGGGPTPEEQSRWTVLKQQADTLVEDLSEPVGVEDERLFRQFAPLRYAPAEAEYADSLETREEGEYKLALEQLDAAVEALEEAWKQAEPRAHAWESWHGFVTDYGTRKLSGASGRHIGARFEVTGDVDPDGTISAFVKVEYWCESNNELLGAPGKFVVSIATLEQTLSLICPRGSKKREAKEYVLGEEVLLDYDPSQLSVSRDDGG